MSAALERMADLLALDAGEDPGTHPNLVWGRAELAFDLAGRLRTALSHAHSVVADDISRDQLAARTLNRLMDLANDGQAMPNAVSIDLCWPDDDRATVRIEHADFKDDAPTGWTLLRSNRPSPELTGAQHLAIQNALETLAATLGAHLRTDATTETEGAIS